MFRCYRIKNEEPPNTSNIPPPIPGKGDCPDLLAHNAGKVTLLITGGLRTESDFVKALALGADGVAIANSAMQAIGCLGMRACHTNNCPVGIATQKKDLRARLVIQQSAKQLQNFLEASVHLMQVLARACGHHHLNQFAREDLTTWKRDVAYLTGVPYGGVTLGS